MRDHETTYAYNDVFHAQDKIDIYDELSFLKKNKPEGNRSVKQVIYRVD